MTDTNAFIADETLSPKARLTSKAEATRTKVFESTDKKTSLIRQMSDGRGDLFHVNPMLIKVKDGFNSRDFTIRDNVEHVESLAKSIAEVGVKNPVTVFIEGSDIFLTDGECRLRGTLLAIDDGADIATIPVIVESRHSSEADRLFSQVARNSGKNLTNFEKGVLFKKLLDLGWAEKTIAAKGGVSLNHVVQILEMNAAPAELKEMVTDGRVSFTLAWQTFKEHGSDGAATVAALSKGMETAKAAGKEKVTKKLLTASGDVDPDLTREPVNRVPMKKTLATIFKSVNVSKPDTETDTVTIVMNIEDYDRVKGLLGL